MRKFHSYRIIYVLLIALMFNLVGYSQNNETNEKPDEEKILKYGLLDEIAVKYTDQPSIDRRSNFYHLACLMIGDKVYCVDKYYFRYDDINDDFKPEEFKLWVYDIAKDEWKVELETNQIPMRHQVKMFNYDGKILIYGGCVDLAGYEGFLLLKCFNDGYIYDPSSKEIKKLPTENAPSPRAYNSTVFNGEELIVFGGVTKNLNILNDGAIFNFKTWKWRKFNSQGVFSSLALHKALWLPKNEKWQYSNCMLVWGGTDFIEAIYKKQLDHKDKYGGTFEHEIEVDKFEFTMKGLIAVYFPDEDKWKVIEKMNYEPEDEEYGYRTTHSSGRKGSEIALAGDYIIEFGGKDNNGYWCYHGRKFSLTDCIFEEMSDKNLPPARINHALIPFKEPNAKGELRNKVLVAFGDQLTDGCQTGWHSRTCSVFNIEDDKWEKKLYCPFTNFTSSKHFYVAYDENRIFYHDTTAVVYDIQNDLAERRYGINFNFFRTHWNYFRYLGDHTFNSEDGRKATDYYYTDSKDYVTYLNDIKNYQIYRLRLPENYDRSKHKVKFEKVGKPKQLLAYCKQMECDDYVVVFSLKSIYFTDEDNYPMPNSYGFVLNKKTGEIYDIPCYENSLARETASVVICDNKLYIIGGKHREIMEYNEYSWDNSDGRVLGLTQKNTWYEKRAECAMPMEKRKEMYPDYPYMNDMYIFDLGKKTWSRQVFPENIKARNDSYATTDNQQILIVGGYRNTVQDGIDPKYAEDFEDLYRPYGVDKLDYIRTDGFVYDPQDNSFTNIEEFEKQTYSFWSYEENVEDLEIPFETKYKVFNGNVVEINSIYFSEYNEKDYFIRKYNFDAKQWDVVNIPEIADSDDLGDGSCFCFKDAMYFTFRDDKLDEEFRIYKFDKELQLKEFTSFHDEYNRFDQELSKDGSKFSKPEIFLVTNGIMCNSFSSGKRFDESSNMYRSKGFIFDFEAEKNITVEGFPYSEYIECLGTSLKINIEEINSLWDQDFEKFEKKYGENIGMIFRIIAVIN